MADKFNMEGGYFSPQGYMRIDAGGSHDENPNGGVQIGVDSQGIPNMLEQDESVYNDYVYSDNIRAGKKFLQQNHLPEKYAGKLYSEIADILVGEAKDRPLDPISNNGLNAMLVRLASAQDAQKAEKEQKALEAELSKLSPEELDQLEAMLAEQEAVAQPSQEEVVPQQEVLSQQGPIMEQPVQPQMMASGGLMHRFDEGGEEEYFDTLPAATVSASLPSLDTAKGKQYARTMAGRVVSGQMSITDVPSRYRGYVSGELAGMRVAHGRDQIAHDVMEPVSHMIPFVDTIESIVDGNYGSAVGNGLLDLASIVAPVVRPAKAAVVGGRAAKAVNATTKATKATKAVNTATTAAKATRAVEPAIKPAKGVTELMDDAYRMLEAEKAYEAAYAAKEAADAATKVAKASKTPWQVAKDVGTWTGRVLVPEISIPAATWKASAKFGTGVLPTMGRVGVTIPAAATGLAAGQARNQLIKTGVDQYSQRRYGTNTRDAYNAARATDPFAVPEDDPFVNTKARGGLINRYDNPYGSGLLDRGTGFGGAMTTQDMMRKVYPMPQLTVKPLNLDMDRLQEAINRLPDDSATTLPPLTGPLYDIPQTGFRPQNMELLGVPKLELPPVRDNLATIRYKLRNGIPLISAKPLNISLKPFRLPLGNAGTKPAEETPADDPTKSGDTVPDPTAGPTITEGEGTDSGDTDKVTTPAMLPTWPRYAGALASGILGVYNAFQRPDRYNIRHYNPEVPSARMHLIDPVYNPLDQNLLVNEALASGAGTVRALQNSGLGPSTGAALLAADYNLGRNIGDARAKVWDANNQRLNNVIAQRNGNAETLGNFDYMNSRDRSQIMNMARLRNIQNDLMRQRLNYAAEGEKYAALQSNIDSMSKSLAGIGNENFSMNQINNDSAYDYIALPGGGYAYMPKTKKDDTTNSSKNGGSLMRPYKKK